MTTKFNDLALSPSEAKKIHSIILAIDYLRSRLRGETEVDVLLTQKQSISCLCKTSLDVRDIKKTFKKFVLKNNLVFDMEKFYRRDFSLFLTFKLPYLIHIPIMAKYNFDYFSEVFRYHKELEDKVLRGFDLRPSESSEVIRFYYKTVFENSKLLSVLVALVNNFERKSKNEKESKVDKVALRENEKEVLSLFLKFLQKNSFQTQPTVPAFIKDLIKTEFAINHSRNAEINMVLKKHKKIVIEQSQTKLKNEKEDDFFPFLKKNKKCLLAIFKKLSGKRAFNLVPDSKEKLRDIATFGIQLTHIKKHLVTRLDLL